MRYQLLSIVVCFTISACSTAQQDLSAHDSHSNAIAPILSLDCETTFTDERASIALAPSGTQRLSQHHLQIPWHKGVLEYIDMPPYDDPVDGVSYLYCGYNPALDMHLVHKKEWGSFSGLLIDNQRGDILPGGFYASFSHAMDRYIVAEQFEGMDGEQWSIYNRDGESIWSGSSTMTHGSYDYIPEHSVYFLSNPHWTDEDLLQATRSNVYHPEIQESIILQSIEGKWRWITQGKAYNRNTDNVTLSPDGGSILTITGNKIIVSSVTTGEISQAFEHRQKVYDAQFSPDGQYVLSTTYDSEGGRGIFYLGDTKLFGLANTAALWSIKTGKQQYVFDHNPKHRQIMRAFILNAEFSPNGQYILTLSLNGSAYVWCVETGKPVSTFDYFPRENVIDAHFSPDGKKIVLALDNGSIEIWSTSSWQCIQRTQSLDVISTNDTNSRR